MTTIKLPKPLSPGPNTPFYADASFRSDGKVQINGSINDEAIRRLGVRHDGFETVDVFVPGFAEKVATLDFKTQVAVGGNPPNDLYNTVVSLTPAQQEAARTGGLSFKIHLNQGAELETDENVRVGGTPPNPGGSVGPGPNTPFYAEAGLRADGTLKLSGSVNDQAIRNLGRSHDGYETVEAFIPGFADKIATLEFKTQVARGGNPPNDLYNAEVKLTPAQQAAARTHGISFRIRLNNGGELTGQNVRVTDLR